MKTGLNFRRFFLFTGILLAIGYSASGADDSLYIQLADSIDYVVAADGSGDFLTVQEAIDAISDDNPKRIVVYIRNGGYKEKILVPESKTNITLIGQNVDSTILTYDDYNGRIVGGDTLGTSDSYSFALEADDFLAMNITIRNSAGDVGQAVALRTRGDRQSFLHCRLSGYQDTYYTYGSQRNYLHDCQIIGAIDYIFGSTTVIFDSCQIHSVRDNSYITAASTPENVRFGYVFFNCRLTASYGKLGIFLGRPWRPYANTVFYQCEEGDFLSSAGWSIWNGNNNHLTCFYAEYQCSGEGSDTTSRANWAHQLTDEQAASYKMDTIFSASTSPEFDGDWLPDFENDYYYQVVKKYTVKFMDSINCNARIKSIRYEGEELEGFSPAIYNYGVELPEGTTTVPVLEAETEDSLATCSFRYPTSVPNLATVIGTARDKGTHVAYFVYLSVDSAYSNAKLKLLKYQGIDVPDFSPDTYDYNVELEAGSIYVPNITAYTQISQATKIVTEPESLPGTAIVDVTAVDKVTTARYTIDFTVASGLEVGNPIKNNFFISNPFCQELFFKYDNLSGGELKLSLYSIQGRLIAEKNFSAGGEGDNQLAVYTGNLPEGCYIYKMVSQGEVYTGKVVKIDK